MLREGLRPTLLVVLLATAGASAATTVFRDGFEAPMAPGCVAGPGPAGLRLGDLGDLPPGYDLLGCLEIANDLTHARTAVASAAIPFPREPALRDGDLARLALVGPGNRRLAAQFDVLARWGGPLAGDGPIRWLVITAAAAVDANAVSRYALVRLPTAGPIEDPFAAAIVPAGDGFLVTTGVGRFELDPARPALFARIAVRGDEASGAFATVFEDGPGAGPYLRLVDGTRIDTAGAGQVTVDHFEVVEAGPVKVVVLLNGRLIDPAGAGRCEATTPAYERFGYSLVATFLRGRRDVHLQYHFRNTCSNANGAPWDDDAVEVAEAGFRFRPVLDEPELLVGGAGAITSARSEGIVQVRQRRGGGTPWRRRAEVLVAGAVREAGEFFASPLVGLADPHWLATVQMPWMRFREPQALTAGADRLGFEVITERLVVGEGKGLWNSALLTIEPAGRLAAIEDLRRDGRAELERGLLVRADRAWLAASGVLPPLGTDAPSPVKDAYRDYLTTIHANTIERQWPAARTYGSQLWPDVQFDERFGSTTNASPADNNVRLNYWNPSGAELIEFLRTGEPRWVWDFALPQSWLQTFTAYLNLFDQRHGRSNGAAVNSGGSGEGHWHRNAFGSDDYTYNQGLWLAYVLRPNAPMRQRFGHAGQMVIDRYDVPREAQATRDPFLSRVSPDRGILQHFENLANCAEFVPGDLGAACHDKLLEVLDELAVDNLRAGMICQGDVPDPARCDWPQTFMIAAMQYGFFLRLHLNYSDVLAPATAAALRRTLTELPRIYYDLGMDPVGAPPELGSTWAALLSCTIVDDAPASCERSDNGDGVSVLFANRPHVLALGLLAHWLDPTIDLCATSRDLLDALFDGQQRYGPLTDYLGPESGWYKGAAQVVQQLAFAVGLHDKGCR